MSVVRLLSALFIVVSACARPRADEIPAATELDSVVLERTVCYGTCPAYRLRIANSGVVHFQSRNSGDTTVALDTLPPSTVGNIAVLSEAIGFGSLPDTVRKDRVLCSDYATDHPTIVVGLFGKRSKQVVYYTGCYTRCCEHTRAASLKDLTSFAAAIDSMTNSARWVRPNRGR